MLEQLTKFLVDSGIQIPEGTNKDGILEIISALLKAEEKGSSESDQKMSEKSDQQPEQKPQQPEQKPQKPELQGVA